MSFLLFSGLTKLEANGQVSLCLADTVCISSDLMCYTFTLKETKFNDGSDLTAYDFERSWKEAIHPDFACPCAHNFFPIKNAEKAKKGIVDPNLLGVEALDEKTLFIELEHPTPYFLELMSFCPFFPVPKHFDPSKKPVSNGPFNLKRWQKNSSIELEKNPRYWGQKHVKLDGIHISIIEDQDLALQKYEQNELDLIGDPLSPLPSNSQSQYIEEKRISPIVGSYFLAFNCNVFPFNNLNIRKAFFHLIPRDDILNNLSGNHYQKTISPIPGILYGNENRVEKKCDEKKALLYFQKGLKELKLKPKNIKLDFLYECNDISKQIINEVKQRIKDTFQIEVSFHEMNFKGISDRLLRKDFEIALTWWVTQYKDPMNFFERFKYKTISKNFSGWENIEYILLLDKAAKMTHSQRRMKILEKAEKVFMDDYPIAPILQFHFSFLQKPHVKGVTISPVGSIHFDKAFIDQKALPKKKAQNRELSLTI